MPVASFRVSSSVELHLKLRQAATSTSHLMISLKINSTHPRSKNDTSPKKIIQYSPLQIRMRDGHSLIKPHSIGGVEEHLQGSSLSEPWEASLQHGKAESHPEPGLSPPARLCTVREFHLFPGFELQVGHMAKCILKFCFVSRFHCLFCWFP